MRELRYRQAIYTNGKFRGFHFWGFSKGGFTAPETGVSSVEDATKNSGQFTGLRDREGKEIYEGDVCEYSYFDNPPQVGSVVWHKTAAGFTLGGYPFGMHGFNGCAVIGNIYEHPEEGGDGI